jgi:hypothetical protein
VSAPIRFRELHDEALLRQWYEQEQLSLEDIAGRIGCAGASVVRRAMRRLHIATRSDARERYTQRSRGKMAKSHEGMFVLALNPNWKGGVRINNAGYRMIKMPSHPGADGHGYVNEHRLVVEQHLGRFLSDEEVVHHKNHCRTDNRIENLHLCANASEHARIHAEERYHGKSIAS